MVTQEKLQEHIAKTKQSLAEVIKKAGDNKYDPDVSKLRKKFKRLIRKNNKVEYAKKKEAEKGEKKKNLSGRY